MSMTAEAVRAAFKEGDDVRDAGLTTPSDIVRKDDVRYASEDACQLLDLYRPRGCENEDLPVIISIHGGAWVYGDKERYQYYCMSLAEHGFAVVNFTYRLAPEARFPAALEDTSSVIAWVLEHAQEEHLDVSHIFGVGDSAGAHMLAMYAEAATDTTYAKTLGITVPQGFRFTAVALNCGAYKIEAHEPTGDDMADLTSSLMGVLLPGGGTNEELETISPLLHVTDAFPPAFIMTADGDFLRADALPFVLELDRHDVECLYRYNRSDDVTLGHVFHCNMRLKEAARANAEECAFFRTFL